MALQQAVSFSSTTFSNLLTFPQNPKFKLPSSITFPSKPTHTNFNLKCSKSITNGTYPKPTEIPWNKDLSNSVNLIGFVADPVETKKLPSGKIVAWTRLSVKKYAKQMSWINLTFWGELAHVASHHVKQGQQIHVSGRLVTDTVDSVKGKQQTYYKVIAEKVNFIHRGDTPVSSDDQDFDFTMSDEDKKVSNAGDDNAGSVVELWQAFFANPEEWWDNRKKKRNPKAPDFKHKDTGEALWITSKSSPPWVKSQLEIFDIRMESSTSQNTRMRVDMVSVDEILSL